MRATVNTDFLRIRAQPNTSATVIGLLKQNDVIEVLGVEDGWAQVALQAGGATVRQEWSNDPAIAYVYASYLLLNATPQPPPAPEKPKPEPPKVEKPEPDKPKPEPPKTDAPKPEPPKVESPSSIFHLGVNALVNDSMAYEEAKRGCRYFLIMNRPDEASRLKRDFPDAVVMLRRFFDHGWMPNVDQIIDGLWGAKDPNLVYIGLNETDQIGQDGAALRKRAELDIAVAWRIKQISGATYAAGTFSMGTPDFTSAETCRIIREMYAPYYNSGLIGFDMHLYSPDMKHIDKPGEHQWFERRWEFLFTKCGFDPSVRAIYCSETGLDEAGVGGFRSHAANKDYFRDWAKKYIALQEAPLVIGGRAYPSPILGGAIFQLGGNRDPKWDGYEIVDYLPELREFYNRPVAKKLKRHMTTRSRTRRKD